MRHYATVGAPGFLGKPVQMVNSHSDLALALSEGFAIFQSDQTGNFFTSAMDFVGDFVKQFATPFP